MIPFANIIILSCSILIFEAQIAESRGGKRKSRVDGGSGDGNRTVELCPNNWFRFEESCYLFSRFKKATWLRAQQYCMEKGGTLFVPNTINEWEVIVYHATLYQWSWIGLSSVVKLDGVMSSAYESNAWITKNEDELHTEALPWLNRGTGHGKTAATKCVAFYRAWLDVDVYSHWYPCHTDREYVCERNSTLINDN